MKQILVSLLAFGLSTGIPACEFPGISFDSNFSSARLNGCQQLDKNSFILTIDPENHPVNNSPWYAFKVIAKESQSIDIVLEFNQGRHRYLPKRSDDGLHWSNIPHSLIENRLIFTLEVGFSPVWISSQEIITNDYYRTWMADIESRSEHEVTVLGLSTENRPIYVLQSHSESRDWVVVTGRMHPPEIPGALALFPFVEELLFNEDPGRPFRKRFNILMIPNMNPDGVEHGHWRHNANGVDLNRDWQKLKQPETRAVHDWLQEVVNRGGRIVFGIDFHATRKNVFYTMPSDYGHRPALLTDDWLNRLDEMTPGFEVVVKPGNNPDKGVFKQYIAKIYGVPAITYEMGDTTDRDLIRSVAKVAAVTFMQTMLATPAGQFGTN